MALSREEIILRLKQAREATDQLIEEGWGSVEQEDPDVEPSDEDQEDERLLSDTSTDLEELIEALEDEAAEGDEEGGDDDAAE